jgi:hypothetical protein
MNRSFWGINIMLLSLYPIMSANPILQAEESAISYQCINEEGWHVPGTEQIDKARILYQGEDVIDGHKIQISRIKPIKEYPGGEDVFTSMPIITVSGNTILYRSANVVALELKKYSFGGKDFCYLATMATCMVRVNKVTAVAGGEFTYAYCDETGNGKFQTREFANMMIGSPTQWHVRLPEWVKNGPTKR